MQIHWAAQRYPWGLRNAVSSASENLQAGWMWSLFQGVLKVLISGSQGADIQVSSRCLWESLALFWVLCWDAVVSLDCGFFSFPFKASRFGGSWPQNLAQMWLSLTVLGSKERCMQGNYLDSYRRSCVEITIKGIRVVLCICVWPRVSRELFRIYSAQHASSRQCRVTTQHTEPTAVWKGILAHWRRAATLWGVTKEEEKKTGKPERKLPNIWRQN